MNKTNSCSFCGRKLRQITERFAATSLCHSCWPGLQDSSVSQHQEELYSDDKDEMTILKEKVVEGLEEQEKQMNFEANGLKSSTADPEWEEVPDEDDDDEIDWTDEFEDDEEDDEYEDDWDSWDDEEDDL